MTNRIGSLVAALAVSVGVGVGNANAHEAYGGVNLAFLEYSANVFDDDASLDTIYGRLGAQLNENISMEFRAGFGVDDDTIRVLGSDVKVELDSLYGAYVRGGFPITEIIYPYAVIGYSRVEVDYAIPSVGASDDDSDVSYGIGLDLNLDQNIALNIEYMNWYDDDDVEIEGGSVGVVIKF